MIVVNVKCGDAWLPSEEFSYSLRIVDLGNLFHYMNDDMMNE